MAAISVYVGGLRKNGSVFEAYGDAWIDGQSSDAGAGWSAELDPAQLAAGQNDDIMTAAIAAAEAATGMSVGALDKKTLFCGAMGI